VIHYAPPPVILLTLFCLAPKSCSAIFDDADRSSTVPHPANLDLLNVSFLLLRRVTGIGRLRLLSELRVTTRSGSSRPSAVGRARLTQTSHRMSQEFYRTGYYDCGSHGLGLFASPARLNVVSFWIEALVALLLVELAVYSHHQNMLHRECASRDCPMAFTVISEEVRQQQLYCAEFCLRADRVV
jgi:hypothetical protein